MKKVILIMFLAGAFFPCLSQTIVDQSFTGGGTNVFEQQNNVLFIPKGSVIEFYDTSGQNMVLINSVFSIECNDLVDILVSDNSLFVIGDIGQVVVYDVSDLENPVISNQGQMPEGVNPYRGKNILALSADLLYIATEDGIYNTNMGNADLVFEKCIDEDVYAIAIHGDWMYGISNSYGTYSLKSWNMADPGYAVQYNQIIDNVNLDIFNNVLFILKGRTGYNTNGVTLYQVDGAGGLDLLSQIGVGQSHINSVYYDQLSNRLITGDTDDNTHHYVSVYNVVDLQNPVLEFPRYETLRTNVVKYQDGSVYYSCQGDDRYFVEVEVSDGSLTETAFLNAPYSISVTCNVDDNLFVGSESLLYLYRLGESNNPELVKTFSNEDYPWGNNIKALAGSGGRIYVMDGSEAVTVCDVDGDDLLPRGSFNAALTSVNYLAGNEDVVASIEFSSTNQQVRFFDCSDADNPVETLTWDWSCRDWVITPDDSCMIFSSLETNDVFFYNISDPASVYQTGTFTVSGTRASLAVSDSLLIVASLTSADPAVSTIEVFSISDISAPVLLAQANVEGQVFDLQIENDYILLALGEDGWSILDLARSAPASSLKSVQFFFSIEDVMDYYLTAFACYTIPFFRGFMGDYFFALLQNMFGDIFTEYFGMPSFVVQLPRQAPVVVNYELEMAISPPEAKNNSCTVSPAEGKHTYTAGTDVNLAASDNPTDGWVFKQWQGATGEKNTTVTMNADKKVTAVFEEVSLYLSKDVSVLKCPCEYETESGLKIDLNFYLDATGDDWVVTGFEIEDLDSNFYSLIDEGKILTAGATHATFTWEQSVKGIQLEQNIEVPEPNIVEITVSLTPNSTFIEQAIENGNSRFTIRVKGSYPANKDGGKSSGKPEANLIFGPVFNNHDNYFSSINKAVQDASTLNGDTVIICPKLYQENIIVDKNLTLAGIVCGESKPVLSTYSHNSVIIFTKDSLKIQDLGFISQYGAIKNEGSILPNINVCRSDFNCSSGMAFPLIDVKYCGLKIEDSKFTHTSPNSNEVYCINTEYGSLYLRSNTFSGYKYGIRSSELNSFKGMYDNSFKNIDYPVNISNILRVDNSTRYGVLSTYFCPFENNTFKSFVQAIKIGKVGSVDCSDSDRELVFYRNSFSSYNLCDIAIEVNNYNTQVVIDDNYFDDISVPVVLMDGYKTKIEKNEFYFSETDITLNSSNYSGEKSERELLIDNNRSNNSKCFINIKDQEYTLSVTNNKAVNIGWEVGNSRGISIEGNPDYGYKDLYFAGNTIRGYCTALHVANINHVISNGNTLKNATCKETGISIDNSSGSILNCALIDNAGSAVSVSGNSNIEVAQTNLWGNETAISNNSLNPVIANNNYWGTPDGPGGGDVSGDVVADEWLAEQKKLIVSFSYDTLFLPFDSGGEIPVISTNFDYPNDSIWFTFSGELQWVFVPDDLETIVDSTGVINYLLYETPPDATGGGFATLHVSALSTVSGEEATDSVVLALYEPVAATLSIDQESFSVFVDDSVFISASVYDQYQNEMGTEPVWEAGSGRFADGFYFPSQTGLIPISATVEELHDELILNIVDEIPVVASIAIDPETTETGAENVVFFGASATDQFGYPIVFSPVWETSNGSVVSGIYLSPDYPGQFTVTVYDTLTDVSAQAVINVSCIVEEIISETICDGDSYLLGETVYTESGTYEYTFYREGLCDSMVILVLSVLPLPDVQLDLPDTCFLESDPLVLEYGIPLGGTYSMNGETIAVFEPAETGDYELQYSYTDENGCTGLTSAIITVVSAIGSDWFMNPGMVSVYPNPATGQLIVEFGQSAGWDMNLKLELVSMSGQKLLAEQISLLNRQKEILDVSHFVSGIYLLKIHNAERVFSQIVVIR